MKSLYEDEKNLTKPVFEPGPLERQTYLVLHFDHWAKLPS